MQQRLGVNLWLLKPVALSRGRGIHLVADVAAAKVNEAMVAQRYVANPMLVEGYKFDLRLYVLVTRVQPMEAWIYKVRALGALYC